MTAERDDGLAASLEESPQLVALRAEALAEMALFEDCSPEQLHDLATRMRPLRAERGQVLMRQGEQAVSFILIQSGSAEVIHTSDDGSVVLAERHWLVHTPLATTWYGLAAVSSMRYVALSSGRSLHGNHDGAPLPLCVG